MQSSKKELFWVRIPVGSSTLKELPTDDVERFLAMLRFDSREKLKELPDLKSIFSMFLKDQVRVRFLI
jgi:hypothetical protein